MVTTTAPRPRPAPERRLSLAAFLARPETEPASEYADGEVQQKPMPGLPHSALQEFLLAVLRAFARPRRLGRSFGELRCTFGPPGSERSLVPDVVFVSAGRLPRGDLRQAEQFRAPPDLAVEITSPGQSVPWMLQKTLFYLQHGVRLVWVVDPTAESVLVLAPGAEPRSLTVDDTLDGGDVLPGFTLALADLFAELRLDAEEQPAPTGDATPARAEGAEGAP